ncbi:D-alanyl-D-alanine carboxypeptidase [Acetitomaculum ruminis DSM 5522]|uniref:D-alanyl-D-alanine carboxypeptidase n=1 Tax=Acetitomaculum ruminis DSM 5522 TaxID=1120918 RepID=A0A1I0W818_9FIRM|nr:D-alanyl-D-alanine carboxypeptidase family protein [Acetitomaculum ruminis]SFA84852.1 D-alanyl-D-alanine carboxypeptidase [Acetitomaculum ruminis DSM 5522]
MKIKKITGIFLTTLTAASLVFSPIISHAEGEKADFSSACIDNYEGTSPKNQISAPQLLSEAGIVMDASTGTILYEKNSKDKHFPASITKLMTVLLTLENCKLNETVKFSHDAVYSIEFGSANIGIKEGEELSLKNSLYGILLASANEVSYAVGEHVAGGNISDFSNMMNEKATQIGCLNSHFCNPHGLHDDDHYTCAYDMALITKNLLKYNTFRIIIGTKTYTIPPTNITPEARVLNNTHKMLKNNRFEYEGVEGGKTGFTNQALNTLVTCAKRDGLELIAVSMYGNQTHYPDTATLFNYGFNNYKSINIADEEKRIDNTNAAAFSSNNFLNENEDLFSIDEDAKMAIPKNTSLSDLASSVDSSNGEFNVSYSLDNKELSKVKLNLTNVSNNSYTFKNNIKSNAFNPFVYILIVIAVIIFGLLILLKSIKRKRRR